MKDKVAKYLLIIDRVLIFIASIAIILNFYFTWVEKDINNTYCINKVTEEKRK